MSAELIKRIDEWLAEILPDDLAELLQGCRAALSQSEPVRYVPFTFDELDEIQCKQGLADLQYAVINRAIAQGAKLEVQE